MRSFIASAALILIAGSAFTPAIVRAQSPTPAPSASPAATPAATPTENPAHTAIAKAELDAWLSGKVDVTKYGGQLKTMLTPSAVQQVGSVISSGGTATFDGYHGIAQQMGVTVETYGITFAKPISIPAQMGPTTNKWQEALAFDSNDKIVFIRFYPVQ